jgi:uroporphyrinogen decarboxylase
MQPMTSRERVLATMAGRPTDRVAADFRAEPEVFAKLRAHLRLPDDEAVRVWARSDVRDVSAVCNTGGYGGYSAFGWTDVPLPDGTQRDLWGVRRRRVAYDGGTYIDIVEYPLKPARGIDELRRYAFPDPRALFDFSPLPEAIARLNAGNEYFTLIEGESLHDRCWALRGIEEFMMDLLTDEDAAQFLIEHMYRFFYDYTAMILRGARGKLDAIGLYNDLGNQLGMMISPALYRRYFKEKQRRLIAMIKDAGVKVFYHSCGGVRDILPDLVEIGVDILDPLQLNALQLTPAQLRERVGDRLTLHGGLDVQALLVRGTPAEVRAGARALKQTLGRNGRYILSCTHLLQVDVPIPNIEALVAESAC